MKKILFFTLSLLSIGYTQAQDPKTIFADPEILWAAETYITYNPDMTRDELRKHGMQGNSTLLKALSSPTLGKDLYPEEVHQLNEKLFRKSFLSNEKLKVYYDSLLTMPITVANRLKIGESIDTIPTFDPETFEKIMQIVVKSVDYEQIVSYRFRVLVYYHQKDRMYRALPLCMAPIGLKGQALFWIPMNSTDKTELANHNIDWAKRVVFSCPIQENHNCKILKKQPKSTIELFFQEIRKPNNGIKLYNVMSTLGNEALTNAEIQNLGNEVDSIITFDPKTFEKTVQAVKNEIRPDNIKDLRFVMDWVWDKERQQLFCRPLGFAPIIERFDQNKKFLNSGPVFYKREKSIE